MTFRLRLERDRRAGRRREAQPQNALPVPVLDERIDRHRAVSPPDGEDRELTVKWHEGLEQRRDAAEPGPRRVGVGGGPQHRLPFAVVAEPPRLEDGGAAQAGERPVEVSAIADGHEGGHRHAELPEERLLGETVLGDLEGRRRRKDGHAGGETVGGGHRHVLEFVGHGLQALGEAVEGRRVVVRSHDQLADGARRRAGVRVEDAEAEAQRKAGQREHPPELAAADDAERHGRRVGTASGAGRRGSGSPRTARVCVSR